PQKRFLRSASLSHSHTPNSDRTLQTSKKRSLSHTPNSDSYGALRYRIPTSPNSELLTAALRYRIPQIPKSELTSQRLRYRILTSPKAIP
ncbi:hypothetical protein, partial [Aphanizomenon flos-aquae]|uniref:hypothetical protein n=1 Tax=Aphanizomenon flos-aquae TaxID=1176 RepID=UPI0013621082